MKKAKKYERRNGSKGKKKTEGNIFRMKEPPDYSPQYIFDTKQASKDFQRLENKKFTPEMDQVLECHETNDRLTSIC